MATTYNNLYLDLRQALRGAGVTSASLEAREMVCFAADKTRESFFRDLNLYISEETAQKANALLRRRLLGEPLAYLIGEWEFYGLPLEVTRDVLIPRVDTERLAARAISLAREAGENARVLDLCAGSGCVGLAVAQNAVNCRVVLADVSETILALCKRNARRNNLLSRVTVFQTDALEPPPALLWDFDVIVCNPPYIPTADIETLESTVKDWEPRMALDGGADGLQFYRAIAEQWQPALRLGGTLVFEVGAGQADDVGNILCGRGYESIRIWEDDQKIERIVEGRCNQ
ncbi:MAG: peptide chain release factor N(5)-glutamine methyltransferase [Oscillospiraceae bacterium]|nr:peptide chain release factor N(5)-glutamine methyltransferase [Oscillospiraceae bacterium]